MANTTKPAASLASVGSAAQNWMAQFEVRNAAVNNGSRDLGGVAA
jgi:aldehyde:ferredoxin oxidoreductase